MGQTWPTKTDDDDAADQPSWRAIAAAFLLAIALTAVVIFCSAVSL